MSIPGGGCIDTQHREDRQSAVHCLHELLIADQRSCGGGGGAENYATILSLCEARGCN